MTRFRWATVLALAGLLVVGGMAVAQDRAMTAAEQAALIAGGPVAQDGAQTAAAQAAQARLAEIQANREATISELMGVWAPSRGADQLELALREASARQLLQVSRAESFLEVNKILLGPSAGGPFGEVVANSLGDTDQDYVYTPVEPCRIFDTRNVGGAIPAGGTRDFYVYGGGLDTLQGGNPAGCPAPKGEPRAVHLNVTVVPVGAQGNVRVYPANVATPQASAVNFKLGTNIANALTVQTYYFFGPQEIQVFAGAGAAHVLADVMGYYYNVGAGTGTQTIPDGVETTVIFNSENHDLGADYSTSTGIFTVPATGRYNVACHLVYTSIPAGTSRVNIYLKRNAGDLAITWGDNQADNGIMPRIVSGTWQLTAGDTIRCNAFLQTTGASGSVWGDGSASYFSATQIP
jgi:hypothetical protein